MIERRQYERIPLSAEAEISIYGVSPIKCRMVDASPMGARLKVASVLGIPERFDLKILDSRKVLSSRVVWKQPQELGVAFD